MSSCPYRGREGRREGGREGKREGGRAYLQHAKHGDHRLKHDDQEEQAHNVLGGLLGVVLPKVDGAEDEAHHDRVQKLGLHLGCSSRRGEGGREGGRGGGREGRVSH